MHILRRVLLVAASLGALAACGTAGAVRPEPRLALAGAGVAEDSLSAHRAATGFLAAFDSLQWEQFRGYFADDVTMFFPFPQVAGRADGRGAVEGVFRGFFDAQRTARTREGRPMVQGIAPRDLRVQMAGPDVAVVSFHLGAEAPSRRTLVFHRAAGEWKVVHWHASPAPRAASN
jgi:ketosteroid isomerase-like protein